MINASAGFAIMPLGVTPGLMGTVYPLLPRLGFARSSVRFATRQAWL